MKKILSLLILFPLLLAASATNDTIVRPKKDGGHVVIQSVTSGGSSADVITTDDAGNVGIGTTSPTSKLDVSGSLNATTGTISTLNATTGTISTLNATTGTISSLMGVTNGSNACTGCVGERSFQSGSSTSLTSTMSQVASVTLQPGVWIISSNIMTISSNATGTYIRAALATTGGNSTAGTTSGYDYVFCPIITVQGVGQCVIPAKYVNITSATTYYLNAMSDHGAYSMPWFLQAIRIR